MFIAKFSIILFILYPLLILSPCFGVPDFSWKWWIFLPMVIYVTLFFLSLPPQCRGGLVRFANPLATCYFWLGVGDPLFLVSPPQCRGGRGRRLRAVPEERGGTRVSGGKAGGRGGTFGEKIWPSVWQGWQEGMNIYEENRRNISKSGDKILT